MSTVDGVCDEDIYYYYDCIYCAADVASPTGYLPGGLFSLAKLLVIRGEKQYVFGLNDSTSVGPGPGNMPWLDDPGLSAVIASSVAAAELAAARSW
ncbi:hypothetical protein JK2ML_0464 [Mycobacterium leprae Kyoto-2]|uniref:Uncharacterized protein n=4 Tax=Mycobacterium leprae TaxID=1769 RepID=Q9CCT8_MYCLE|nr:hypothetical protein [Mycobacterium leprae]CAR70557.1 hypothetical protein MLBr00464 [Mycobacterium leprae Br4923]BBC16575.1 hypothetical protein JK2ML_0464 [Mycobacterium leprae Kyoto-2]AWV48948.1 hypothetical protein DIJ64_02470 [Mycobacterium leprae]OAR20638.1 hypothetical protein A8144_10055 [Mycobacterium leprae 3125609]OAX70825.1 hypothetical protein A3216_09730 [Mycobacterium leprae 7935681]